jgi:hypothetical protein
LAKKAAPENQVVFRGGLFAFGDDDEMSLAKLMSSAARRTLIFLGMMMLLLFLVVFVSRLTPGDHLQSLYGMIIFISDRVGVMFAGRLVEVSSTEENFRNPPRPRARSLMSAIPSPAPAYERTRKIHKFDPDKPEDRRNNDRARPGHFLPP